jgi:hypothetical protein
VAAVAAGAVALALGGSGVADTASQRCKPEGSSTVVVNDHVRVYRDRPDPAFGGEIGTMVACLRSNGLAAYLDAPDTDLAYRPPALRLNGPLVAVAVADNYSDGDDEFEPGAGVYVWDLRKLAPSRDEAGAIVNATYADRSNANVRIGMIVLRANGSIAWTTCPGTGDNTDIPNTPKPNCLEAGAKDKVWKLDIGTKKSKLLDRGTAIDPRSLRLKSGHVTWLNGGARRGVDLR